MSRIWIPQAAAVMMLIWAFNPGNPYGYYTLLRWVCCAVFAYSASCAVNHQHKDWAWVLGLTAAIYNPIIPVHLSRELWLIVNTVTIGIAVASIFAVDLEHEPETMDSDAA